MKSIAIVKVEEERREGKADRKETEQPYNVT
jgi:hypothetical protein